jgi:hypothetical protein
LPKDPLPMIRISLNWKRLTIIFHQNNKRKRASAHSAPSITSIPSAFPDVQKKDDAHPFFSLPSLSKSSSLFRLAPFPMTLLVPLDFF